MASKATPQEKISLAMLQAESLLSMIKATGGKLPLHKPAMRQLKRRGFNRTDLGAAIDRLVKDGLIAATGTDDGVVLALIKAPAPATAT